MRISNENNGSMGNHRNVCRLLEGQEEERRRREQKADLEK